VSQLLIHLPNLWVILLATSALDTASEKVVQDALAKIRRERKLTTVTVAHRYDEVLGVYIKKFRCLTLFLMHFRLSTIVVC
jgi:ABC-type transport system involved in Fe-S cluster assembly fused permease/ATPase subunit